MSRPIDTKRVERAVRSASEGRAAAPVARAPRRYWTAKEHALLARYFRRKGPAWCAARLGRTHEAVLSRARDHGITQRIWTPRDLKVLRDEWGQVNERTLRAKLGGRSWQSIAKKAERLGLPNPNRGRVTLAEGVRLFGYCYRDLRALLQVEGVPLYLRVRTHARRGAGPIRQRVFDLDAGREAVERWFAREASRVTLVEVRARYGTSRFHTRTAILRLHAIRPLDGYSSAKCRLRVEDVEVALDQHADRSRCWRVPARCASGLCATAPRRVR